MGKSLSKKSLTEKAIKSAQKQPGIRFVTGLIPGGSAVYGLLDAYVRNLEEQRIRVFFDHLEQRGVVLTQDDLSEEFVHKYMITSAAIVRTSRAEKIQLFANMLMNGRNGQTSGEDYEECLSIVDELSPREFEALRILEEFESKASIVTGENQLQHATKFWFDFLAKLKQSIEVTDDDVTSFLQRIARTGCYVEITGGYLDYGGGIGHTTMTYQKIKRLCVGS